MIIERLSNYTGDAIVDNTGSYSYEDLVKQIKKYKIELSYEISSNDIVIIDSDYSFYSIALLLSLSSFPCIIVPIVRTTDTEFQAKKIASAANKTIVLDKSSLVVTNTNQNQSTYLGYIDIINKGSSGIVLFSSGTTGTPKVMAHDFTNLLGSFSPPRRQKSLRFLLFLMFDHIGGLNTLLNCLNNGSPIIIPSDRNPSHILQLIAKQNVNILPTSPTFLNLMLLTDEFDNTDLSSLKLITYGTERMPSELLNKLNSLIPRVKFLQTFGTSETGILKTKSKSSNSLYFKIDDDDVEYKIIENQLFIKSKTSVKGYKDLQSDKFSKDGWFVTGDLVEVDEEGFIKVVGRINDIINVGGQKVLPKEVEDLLNTIEGVIDSTVYAKFNSITGQAVYANVVVGQNIDHSEIKKSIKAICKRQLDKYKRPVKVMISDKILATSRFKKSNIK